MMRKGRAIPQKPWMGLLGLLGCLGFSYFYTGQAYTLVFLSFFGFFSYFWWGKLHGQRYDERLENNQNRAYRVSTGGCFALVFAGTCMIGSQYGETDVHTAYALTVALVSLGFAVAMNVAAFLTYRYDQKG